MQFPGLLPLGLRVLLLQEMRSEMFEPGRSLAEVSWAVAAAEVHLVRDGRLDYRSQLQKSTSTSTSSTTTTLPTSTA